MIVFLIDFTFVVNCFNILILIWIVNAIETMTMKFCICNKYFFIWFLLNQFFRFSIFWNYNEICYSIFSKKTTICSNAFEKKMSIDKRDFWFFITMKYWTIFYCMMNQMHASNNWWRTLLMSYFKNLIWTWDESFSDSCMLSNMPPSPYRAGGPK